MYSRDLAPIAIIAYNRAWHLRQTIEALIKNAEAAESHLYVFSDAPKNATQQAAVLEVRQYLKTVSGFKKMTIIEREENFGLARSVAGAVNFVLSKHERVIVLEDDLVTSRYFLDYMNRALDLYAEQPEVASIHGFFYDLGRSLPDTFFLRGTDCLGWATWKRAWRFYENDGSVLLEKLEKDGLTYAFDYDNSYPYTDMLKDQIAGKISSWAIRWHAATFLKNMLTLNPGISLVKHIGNDGSGTNFGSESFLDTPLAEHPVALKEIALEEDEQVRKYLIAFYRKTFPKPGRFKLITSKGKAIIKRLLMR